jgi:hypothetical protein
VEGLLGLESRGQCTWERFVGMSAGCSQSKQAEPEAVPEEESADTGTV